MTLRWVLASLHLLALGIGLGAVWVRAQAFRSPLGPDQLRRLFQADAWWGAAAVLWIGTGVWRLLAATEKSTGYYLQNHVFLTKMGLLVLILGLELWPMLTLLRWRRAHAQGRTFETGAAASLARISLAQAALVVLMVFAATAMARGIGASGVASAR